MPVTRFYRIYCDGRYSDDDPCGDTSLSGEDKEELVRAYVDQGWKILAKTAYCPHCARTHPKCGRPKKVKPAVPS